MSEEFDNNINLNGINRDEFLGLLWANANNVHNNNNIVYDQSIAKKQVDKDGYADYICGRSIKTQIYNSDLVNSFYYNRDNGENKMEDIIKFMKTKTYNKVNSKLLTVNSKLLTVKSENLKLQNKSITDDSIDPKVLEEALKLYKDLF